MKKELAVLLSFVVGLSNVSPVLAEAGEKKVITMWTIATEADANHEAFVKGIEEYEANHPDVDIQMETFSDASYKPKIKSSVAANELPDIYFTWGGGFSASFVEAGKSLELDEYYENYKEDLPLETLKYSMYDGHIYGIPYLVSLSGIFYNKAMFEEYGLGEPKTWDELIDVCQTFLDNGIIPFSMSVKEAWVLAMLNDALTLKCVGGEKMDAAFSGKGQTYEEDGFRDAAYKLQQLIDMGAFSDSATGLSNDEAVAAFLNGQMPMFVTGAWLSSTISGGAENPADFSFMPFPVCSENAEITDLVGGSADILMVNPKASDPDLAANAAFEITKLVSKYSYQTGGGIASWKVDYDLPDQSEASKRIGECVENATSYTIFSGTLMSGEDFTEYSSLLQQFFVGDLTADEFVTAMDEQLNQQ